MRQPKTVFTESSLFQKVCHVSNDLDVCGSIVNGLRDRLNYTYELMVCTRSWFA